MFRVDENVKRVLLGVYSADPELLKERLDIISYYSFYEGEARNESDVTNPYMKGQSWDIPDELDYVPTKDIRNHTKKLLTKQQRFMFSLSPDILVSPYDTESRDNAEGMRQFIDDVFEETEFWNETFKAFLDCTIGKRVLLLVDANPEGLQYKYYTSDQFTFKTSPHDYKILDEVIIAYMDADSEGKPAEEQVWHRWKYFMDETTGTCHLEKGDYDGNGKPIEGTEELVDTMFDEIPARVITNGGLLGDTLGSSDVADLMPIADSYNRRMSDLSDSLRFKMFEQPVFINASQDSVDAVTIAPNALIDLKATTTIKDATPDVKMLSSSFSFKDTIEYYLDKALSDMYEIMDQPRPEDIKNVPSAKALRFIFYDLMARCEEKWKTWEPAILWTIKFTLKVVDQLNLFIENDNRQYIGTDARISIKHNYPVPEDEESKKDVAMKEVESNVRSRKSYMRDFGTIEDEDEEFEEILQELELLNNSNRDTFAVQMNQAQTDMQMEEGEEEIEDIEEQEKKDDEERED